MTERSPTVSRWWAEKTRLLNGTPAPRIEVYLRSMAPPVGIRDQQESMLDQLRDFQRRGLVENVNETVWGKAVSPDGQSQESPAGRKMLDQIEAFREWADSAEPTVNIPFEESVARSGITGNQFRRIVMPSRCVSLSLDDTVELVVPCRVEGEVIRIQDLLTAIEARRPASSPAVHTE